MHKDQVKLDAIIYRYRDKKGSLIPMLQEVQDLEGYLCPATMRYIAAKTDIPVAEIYGVATFYSMFRLKEQGKHIIRICKGTACHVSDADSIKDALVQSLGLEPGQDTTDDFRFTLLEVACLGCCSLAPVIMIDDQTYGKLTPEAIPGILEKYAY